METVLALTAITLAMLAAEAVCVRRWRNAVSIRVHVNGTRGKSSVTRFVTAALRADGHRVIGKITGVVPTIIDPDGSTRPILRRGPARVQEQVRMLRRAAAGGCDAIVVECMSVNPALQALEARLLKPTVSVLTNILDDHREELGSSPEEWAAGLCSFIPSNGVLVSGEGALADVVTAAAARRKTRVVAAGETSLSAEAAAHAGTHPDAIHLALRVCEELGIERSRAMAAIRREAERDLDQLSTISAEGVSVRFLNGFAVNDVPSAEQYLRRWSDVLGGWEHLVVVLNTRPDRPLRTRLFASWCARLPGLERMIVTGRHAPYARAALITAGVAPGRIVHWSSRQVRDAARALVAMRLPEGTVVAGLGNIAGDGFTILNAVQTWSSKHSS